MLLHAWRKRTWKLFMISNWITCPRMMMFLWLDRVLYFYIFHWNHTWDKFVTAYGIEKAYKRTPCNFCTIITRVLLFFWPIKYRTHLKTYPLRTSQSNYDVTFRGLSQRKLQLNILHLVPLILHSTSTCKILPDIRRKYIFVLKIERLLCRR